jgi:hypothetical protein
MTSKNASLDAAAGRGIISGFLERLEALGFAVDERVDPETRRSVTDVGVSGRFLCRIEFSTFDGRYTLNVQPADRSSETLLVQVLGRVHVAEASDHAHELDAAEAFFRTALVREGLLAEREFPTDYALKRWASSASTVRLPHERSARRRQTEGLVFLPGELPDDSIRSTTPVSKALVNACRLLDVEFDRDRALSVAGAAAAMETDGASDRAQVHLAHSARVLLRGRMRDMEIAWDKGGLDRALVLHGAERLDLRVPLSLVEDAPAPRLW